ncbi:MAG: LuxR C-terminal-related transcriptional regulator [Chloroflexota bacterium]
MVHVIVVSPLPAVRAGLRAMIGAADDLEVVGEAAAVDALSGRDVDATVEATREADILVIDPAPALDTGDLGTLDDSGRRPGLVLLGPVVGDERLPSELAGRAWAYIPRDAGAEQLVAAIRAVAGGLAAVDPSLAGHLFARPEGTTSGTLPPADASDQELTGREREVLGLVAEGLANKAIARRLGISEHTVKFHVAAILTKLGAGSRTEAVHLGARRGLVAL